MEVLEDRVAGLDVHQKTEVACVRRPGEGRTKRCSEVRTKRSGHRETHRRNHHGGNRYRHDTVRDPSTSGVMGRVVSGKQRVRWETSGHDQPDRRTRGRPVNLKSSATTSPSPPPRNSGNRQRPQNQAKQLHTPQHSTCPGNFVTPPCQSDGMTTTPANQRGEQLTFNLVDHLPPRLRVSVQTRKVGQRGIAAVRAVLAEQAARRDQALAQSAPRPHRRVA